MKNLITFGCSFTDKTWPVELARLTNSNIVCKGRGGVGNFYITNRIYETIYTTDDFNQPVYNKNNSVVIVMWSGIDRVDRAVSKKEFHYFDRHTITDNWLHSGGVKGFDNTKTKDRYWYNYYKTYHTEEDSYLQTLQHIIGVQEFLSNRKIPYLFLTYKDIFTDRLYSPLQEYKRAKNLENHINWDKFHFPNGEFGGEFEWVKDNNLTWEDDKIHPSSESHRKFADYLYNLDECRYLFK